MRRILVAVIVTTVATTALFVTPALAASTTWQVQVGAAGISAGALDGRFGNAFYPARIAAHTGDKIAFNITSPHTVTFNRPADTPLPALFAPAGGTLLGSRGQFLNSGFNPEAFAPYTFTVALGASLPPGRYLYICALHLGMRGEIDIVPGSVTLPKRDLAAEASRQIASDLAAATKAADKANEWVEDHPRTVLLGAGTRRATNLRFFPSTITIKAGQTITFLKTKDPTEPHTATFGTEPPNPFAPAGGPPFTFDGTNSVSTGAMVTQHQYDFYIAAALGVPSAMTRTTITFTKPGTYRYICAIHDDAGMVATVVVTP
jgi:plastocyanin